MTQPPVGSVWIRSFPDHSARQSLTVLVLDNSMLDGAETRVLVIYSDGIIKEMLWSSSSFHLYTLVYSPEER